ncbi:MAG TPA: UDP-N-acetylmuramoyl-tripeptide--D-alanyl-D-alanine ligase [Pseudomonadales bacterium]
MLLSEIAAICNGDLRGQDQQVSAVVCDSRQAVAGSLFVALAGERADGHDHVDSAADNGVRAAMVERYVDTRISQLQVDDNLQALACLAAHVRHDFSGRVFAITGSSGKTSTRDMLAGIVQLAGKVSSTRGNQNNELGVPLTILAADPQADYWVLEMGAAKAGDIAYLMRMADPDIAVITNIGVAHIGRFGSAEVLATTKAEIFTGLRDDAVAVINLDDKYAQQWQTICAGRKTVTFSMQNSEADVHATAIESNQDGSDFVLHCHHRQVPVHLQVPGHHQISNALCAAACALAADVDAAVIADGLSAFSGVAGRQQKKRAASGALLIDDSYNANPASVKAAIDVLAGYAGRQVLVLGDMAELGDFSAACHREIGEYAAMKGIDELLTVGDDSRYVSQAFAGKARHFTDRQLVIDYLQKTTDRDDVVLIKGSRSAAMENVVAQLQKQVSG